MLEQPRLLADVSTSDEFIGRHIGPRQSELDSMLEYLGAETVEELMRSIVPASIADNEPLEMAQASSEADALAALRQIAEKIRYSKALSVRAITTVSYPQSFSAMCWRAPPGIPPIRPINRRYHRVGLKLY